MLMIKEIPKEERPRERFLKYGPTTMQTHELLAIILRTGSKDISVLDVSKELLSRFRTLKDLSKASITELTKQKGIGSSKAMELLAAIEIGKRVRLETFQRNVSLTKPEQIFHYMKDNLELKTQEHLIAIYLTAKGELIKKETLFIGSLNSSLIHPREIFKHAVLNSAAAIVLVHNHPSGDPTPSNQDISVTKLIHENSLMMDIKLLDHVIIGRDKYFSFKEKNII